MTHDFNSHNDNFQSSSPNQQPPSSGSLETIQRDRFELLSAYLDGEVTAAERKQVEEWLTTDPTVQHLHTRLLKLRQALQTMPVPTSQRSVQETVDQVLSKVDRKPKMALIWGGAAIAALFVGTVATLFSGDRSFVPQIAKSPEQIQPSLAENPSSESLLIALDRPLVAIPKAPVAQPGMPVKGSEVAPSLGGTIR